MKFHHLGIAGRDIEELKRWVRCFHAIAHESPVVFDPLQKATLLMLTTTDGLRIELITGEMVSNIVKRGTHFYHVCYTVDNIDPVIADLTAQGALIIAPPQKAVLFQGKRVAFLQTPLGIIELLEEQG